jgi:uncharacterized membrane protein affecting hemolysin expression
LSRCRTAATPAVIVVRRVRFAKATVFLPYVIRQTAANATVADNNADIPLAVITNALHTPTRITAAATAIGVYEVRLKIIAHSTSSPSCVFEENLII